MKSVFTIALLAVCALAWADDAPDAAPDAASEARTPPATQPAVRTASAGKSDEFPTPADLVRKMKELEKHQASLSKVAYFSLDRPLQEGPASFSIFGDDGSSTLRSLLDRLHMAQQAGDVKAVLITLGAESSLNYSQATEVRDALRAIVKSGKPVYVYADSYDTPSYTLASGADHVCMLPGGEIMIPGVGMELTFYKGLFDKLGVKADYVQIGEYKGADEEYTRSEPSEELRGELTKLTDALYEQIIEGIAKARHLDRQKVQEIVDQTIVTGQEAKDRGLVDCLIDEDDLRPMLAKDLHNQINLLNEYGRPPREAIDFSNPFSMLSSMFKARGSERESDKPQVAIIYASGVITDGSGEGGLMEESGVGSQTMRQAFRAAARDPKVKAVVVRIDSPGGSALASEVMWQAARHCAAKKPVIVSVGSMAASGGYYLASAGDRIFADPSAIVGSIGVVGGKFVIQGLYEKLGISTDTIAKGKNAGLFSMNRPWSDRQRKMVTGWMKQTYNQFTQRVMTTRTGKIKNIDKVARGRIFLAGQARKLGLVDEIGGIDDALAYAARKSGLKQGEYDVRILPQPRSLADLLMGSGPEAAVPFKPTIEIKDPLVEGLVPALRKSLGQELQMLELLQDRPVVLVAPFHVTIR